LGIVGLGWAAIDKKYLPITITAGLIIFIYFWSMLIGLVPSEYRGLTQRIARVVIFGCIAYSTYEVDKNIASHWLKSIGLTSQTVSVVIAGTLTVFRKT